MEKIKVIDLYNKYKTDVYSIENVKLLVSYIPYTKKYALIKNIIDSTCFNKVEDDEGNVIPGDMYEIDSIMQNILYIMMLINEYTNVEIIFGDMSNSLDKQYDMLNEIGMIDFILDLIPINERKEFDVMLQKKNEDVKTNYYSIQSFIERIINAIGNMSQDNLNNIVQLKNKE